MKQWIKDNPVLVAGIALPVLLVIAFFILGKVPSILLDDPEYDFVIVSYHYDHQHPQNYYLSFEVREEALQGKVIPAKQDQSHARRQYAGIFRYVAAENRFIEIAHDLPEGLDNLTEPLEFTLEETRGLVLDKRSESADGYTFQIPGYRGRGGLLGGIFGMGRRDNDYALSKEGAYFNIPKPSTNRNYNRYDTHFMGWVVAESTSP